MSTSVNIYEAKAKLSDLIERAVAGEDIVIARSGTPRVRLVPVRHRVQPRTPGQLAGRIAFLPGWSDDLTEDFEDA